MILGIGKEVLVFLYAVLAGLTVWCAYRIIICFRNLIPHGKFLTGTEDLLFWIGVSIYLFCKMYETTFGSIRWFFVLGLLCGAGIGSGVYRLLKKTLLKIKKNLEKYVKRR